MSHVESNAVVNVTSEEVQYLASGSLALTQSQQDLVVEHLHLARAIAAKERFRGRGVERRDLEQEAAIALVKAARRYNPESDAKFSTFAWLGMLGACADAICNGSRIRIPKFQWKAGAPPEDAPQVVTHVESLQAAAESERHAETGELTERELDVYHADDGTFQMFNPYRPVRRRKRPAYAQRDLPPSPAVVVNAAGGRTQEAYACNEVVTIQRGRSEKARSIASLYDRMELDEPLDYVQ